MNKLVCQKRAARSAALSERSVYDVLLSVVRAVALGLFVLGVFVCRANVHGVFGIMRSRLILSTAGMQAQEEWMHRLPLEKPAPHRFRI